MKKTFKILAIVLLSVALLLYAAFVFILPNILKVEKYMPQIKKIVAEQSDLVIDIDNPKIVTTPMLAVGLKADKISLKFQDGSDFIDTDKFLARVSLPHLFFLTLKVSKLYVENPKVNVDIVDGKEYKFTEILEKIEKNSISQKDEDIVSNSDMNPQPIKIVIPEIKLSNYLFVINDLKTKDFLKLSGNELLLGYKSGKSLYLKTAAEFYVNDKKNITANIDVNTFLPQMTSIDNEKKEENKIETFINPVAVYKAYDLKTNIDTKIKIKKHKNKPETNGFINIDNLTLNVSGVELPQSKIHLSSKGTTSKIDSELYITKNERVLLDGLFNYSNKPQLQLKLKTDDIYLNNLLDLLKAALASANIKTDIDSIKGEGYFNADTQFKTDFKKLESEGKITVYNCIIRNKKDNKRLSRINSVISLDNSVLKFIDTYIEILDAVFKIDGTIDETSKADISVLMERMPVKKLFNLFIPAEIGANYDINSGNIDLSAKIKGEIQKAKADVNLSVKNFAMTDKVNKISYVNDLFTANFNSDFKTYNGKINNSDFRLNMKGLSAVCDSFVLSLDDKNILIEPSKLKINDSTSVDFSGEVTNYVTNPEFKINVKGKLKASEIKNILGNEVALYIREKGFLPLTIDISGNNKVQTIKAAVDADKDNYVTFVDIDNIYNKNSTLQTFLELKSDSIKIKDTGLYIKNEKNLEEIVSIDGTITKLNTSNPSINLIKLKMPNELTASIVAFPKSKLTVKGSAFLSGELKQPKLRGDINVSNMTIPELYLSMKNAMAKFEGKDLDVDISALDANGSLMDILINADLSALDTFVVRNINIKSNYIDADKVIKVSEAAGRYAYEPSAQSKVSSVSGGESSIPLVVKDGSIDIKQIKSGSIILNDTTSKLSLSDNVLYLNNLVTNGFQGRIFGVASMNLLNGEIKADVKGTGLNVEQTLKDAAGMKDTLTGTMDFKADISLKGATYEEQVKSLNGSVEFIMKDGSLGPFGKLETLLAADNIKSISLLNNILGSVLKTTFDTSRYNTLKGNLLFNNGIAQVNPITSVGDNMSAYISGSFDILKNTADMKLRGRFSSVVTESLGQFAMLSPVKMLKSSSSINILLNQTFLRLSEKVSAEELAQIPSLTKESTNENTTNFQVVIKGDVAKPAKLIRSFKWIALDSEIEEAQKSINQSSPVSIPTDVEDIKKQAKDLVKGLFPQESGQVDSDESYSLKEQLKQTQKNIWEQFKNQTNQSVE